MALGLAVIMIVLIGVMGAGLLTFVRSDLEAVVEVNQGQRALSLADAGVQAARRQLRSDAELGRGARTLRRGGRGERRVGPHRAGWGNGGEDPDPRRRRLREGDDPVPAPLYVRGRGG